MFIPQKPKTHKKYLNNTTTNQTNKQHTEDDLKTNKIKNNNKL